MNANVPKLVSMANKVLYTPQIDKLEGYTQHPRPVSKPYANKINYQSEISTKVFTQKQKKSLSMVKKQSHLLKEGSPSSPGGQFLFDSLRDPRRQHDTKIMGDFLSGTFAEFQKFSAFDSHNINS